MMMSKILNSCVIILFFAVCVCAQTKSIADAENQIKNFSNPANFSVVYDSSRYVTQAELNFDLLEEKDPLAKQFKKFGWRISTLFAVEGIDRKPVRNTLCLITQSKKFQFASSRDLTLRLDSETINLGEADRSTELRGSKASENLCWEIDPQLIRDFAAAEKIEFVAGKVGKPLNSLQLQNLKDYSALVKIDD